MTQTNSAFTEGERKNEAISVRLTPSQHAELVEVARRYGVPLAEAARQAIAYALQVEKKPLPANSGLTEPPKRSGNVKLSALQRRPQG